MQKNHQNPKNTPEIFVEFTSGLLLFPEILPSGFFVTRSGGGGGIAHSSRLIVEDDLIDQIERIEPFAGDQKTGCS